MSKNNSPKNYGNETQKILLCFLLVVFVMVFIFFLFSFHIKKIVRQQNMAYLEGETLNAEKYLDTIFENSKRSITSISYFYSEKMVEPVVDYHDFRLMRENSRFSYIRFVDKNGIGIDSSGTKVDLSDRDYFKRGMVGETGFEAISVSKFSVGTVFLAYAPLYYDGKIIGVFTGVHSEDFLTNLLRNSIFDEEATAYICTRDGLIFGTSAQGKTEVSNVKEYYRNNKFLSRSEFKDLERCFDEGGSCHYSYRKDGKDIVNAFAITNRSGSWVLLQSFPSVVSNKMMKQYNKTLLEFAIVCIVFFVVYLIFFCYTEYKSRRLNEEGAMSIIQKGEIDLADTVSILSDYYYKFIKVNLDTGHFDIIKNAKDEETSVKNIHDWFFEVVRNKFIAPEYEEEFLEYYNPYSFMEKFREGEEKISMRYKRKVNGEFRWVKLETTKSTEYSEDNPIVILYVLDINDDIEKEIALKEMYEAATKANKAKTAFLSNMSHDIRTPINAIIGMTAIAIANVKSREKVQSCLQKITNASKHLLGLINEVLDMSKIESGRVDLQDEDFNIAELIDNMLDMTKNLVKQKNHVLEIYVHDVVHEFVIGDSQRIQQVFMNFISNAIKYTPNGGKIVVEITEKEISKPNVACYEFVFSDTGIGMSEDFQKHIFDPFSRNEDDEYVKNVQGTGLGMSIAQNIVQMMNGSIAVESKLNVGSKFTVTIFIETQVYTVNKCSDFINLPILVVDDDRVACESTCFVLDSLGMDSQWVLSGKEAVKLVKTRHEEKQDFFAVIVDWQMPNMDGVETTRQIRKEVGENVPIIIISAYDWSDIEKQAREAGVNDFISKPIFKTKVTNVFEKLLRSGDSELIETPLKDFSECDFEGKRVLLVEDNDMNAEITTEILKMAKIEVELAKNGKEAVCKFASVEDDYYDLIFMDIQMPIMNGFEASIAIRSMERDYAKRVPIIAMTANAFSDDIVAAKNAKMTDHISKPLRFDILLKILKKVLGEN